MLQSMGSQRAGHDSATEQKCGIESIPRRKSLIMSQTHDRHSLKGVRGKCASNTVKSGTLTRHLNRKARRNLTLASCHLVDDAVCYKVWGNKHFNKRKRLPRRNDSV